MGRSGWAARATVAVIAAALALAAVRSSGGAGEEASGWRPDPEACPDATPALLIKHGWDVPDASFVAEHLPAMQTRGFDGVVVEIPSSPAVLGTEAIPYEQLRDELAPLAAARSGAMRHNFVIVYTVPAASLAGDWSVPLSNLTNLARAAAEVGLEGIAFDNEDYGVVVDPPPPPPGGASPDRAREVGGEALRAVVRGWPDATVLAFIGPWVSEPETARALAPAVPYNDTAAANPLLGPFFVGMVGAAAGTEATVVDGGSFYAARTEEDFRLARAWAREGLAQRGAVVPDELRATYPALVSVGFGVYDRDWLGETMGPDEWTTALGGALRWADRYVWAYTERHDWWGTGWPADPVPERWLEATRAARDRAATPSCAGA